MKIIKLDECYQCPHVFKNRIEYPATLECGRKERVIEDAYKIPKWCPLEDYERSER